MRHTIVIEISNDFDADAAEAAVTHAIHTILPLAVSDQIQVAQYHREDLTEPCVECGAPMDKCQGGPGHRPEDPTCPVCTEREDY